MSYALITFRLTYALARVYADRVKLQERMRRAREQANELAQDEESTEQANASAQAPEREESTDPYDALRELNTQEAHEQLQELIMPR